MKETMDGAAKSRLEKVAQHILPHRPHHLSLSLGRRYPKPDGFWYTGASGPLQYLTFVSQADRGIVLTRPFYDICEEPETAPPMPTKVLAKGEIKKLSIKDYQKKKNSSASPTDNGLVAKTEAKVETRLNGTAANAKTAKEEVKKDITKPTERPEARQEAQRQEKPRPELNSERYVDSFVTRCNVTDRSIGTRFPNKGHNRCPTLIAANEMPTPIMTYPHKSESKANP